MTPLSVGRIVVAPPSVRELEPIVEKFIVRVIWQQTFEIAKVVEESIVKEILSEVIELQVVIKVVETKAMESMNKFGRDKAIDGEGG